MSRISSESVRQVVQQRQMAIELNTKDPEFRVQPVASVRRTDYPGPAMTYEQDTATMMWPNLNRQGRRKWRNRVRGEGYEMCLKCAKIFDPVDTHTCKESIGDTDACWTCGGKTKLHWCTICLRAKYCTKECQRADWSQHRKRCFSPGSTAER